ncbi:MAG: RecQ family ATP-dependent DNA helicase [Methanobrevibacter sp.]|jgi:ATP-dependent DNA helicase RecQ|nr:RecQ family ATP-dependent DNA helicase [Methanobrevibacter sp.]
MTIADIKVALKKFFGYNKFILGQEKLVNSILQKQDSLGIMPTGSGKSLCYQLPALIFDGTTIVISPLISLMKDQVSILQENGISSTYINSSLNQDEYFNRLDLISEGKIKIVYIAPERLYSRGFLNAISQNNINMVAVDEAHCVSQWGHDFRTAYLDIKNFIKELEVRPVVSAFTATATENVEEDIINQLELKNPYTVKTSYDRKNLYFEVRKGKDKFKELLEILSSEKGNSGIIYSNTRKSVESITKNSSNMVIVPQVIMLV